MAPRGSRRALWCAATFAAAVASCGGDAARGGDAGGDTELDADATGLDLAGARPDGRLDTAGDGPGEISSRPNLEVDLARVARIWATGTRPRLPFVREAEDGIAAARDDSPETAWWLPETGTATATIDWRTVLRRHARVVGATVEADGAATGTWRLYAWCGGAELAAHPWEAGRPVSFGEVDAGCATLEAAGGGRIARIHVRGWVDPDALPVEGVAGGGPASSGWGTGSEGARFGVVEGFYGTPWTWRERRAIAAVVPYAYAPKLDPLHRAEWRAPYPDSFVAEFSALAPLGAAIGVSPFIDFDPETDGGVLEAKLAPFIDGGVRAVWLLADDIEFETDRPVGADLGRIHAAAVNRVAMWASARAGAPVEVTFVPTVYSDERWAALGDGDAYLEALQALDDAVRVAWTGPATFSARLTHADLDPVAARIGRLPVVWDNYWANDGGDGFTGRITMAPYGGRLLTPGAERPAVPVFLNPAIQGTLAHAQLAMAIADPEGRLDAGRGVAAAVIPAHSLDLVVDPQLSRTLEAIYEIFDARGDALPVFARLESLVARLESALEAGTLAAEDVVEACAVFARMATLQRDLYFSRARSDLVDELWAPLERVRLDGEQGLYRLMQLREALASGDPLPWEAEAEARAARAVRERFVYSVGALSRLTIAVRGAEAPAVTAAAWPLRPMPPCVVDQPFSWAPFDGATATLASGFLSAGADGLVYGRAEVPGTYSAVVVAVRGAPLWWEIAQIELVCTEEAP